MDETAKKIESLIKGLNGEFTPFAGDDNCENCPGWDGKSNRCECGTRRVYWAVEVDLIYACAD